MDRLVIVVVVAVGCGPAVGVGESSGGSGEGDATSAAASDEGSMVTSEGGARSDVGGSESTGAPPDTSIELWDLLLPSFAICPRLAALDDGSVAVIGNERFAAQASIPHVLVVESDGIVRWTSQGGHSQYDVATDLVAEPGGFVVVGQGDGARKGFVGWMQRWTAAGDMAEVILGMDELGDQISDIETRDATSYWIVGSADGTTQESLFFRGFEEPPTSETSLLAGAFEVQLARAPDGGVYVTADADAGWLTHVDRDGEVLWTMPYVTPGAATSFSLALASTANGDAIVAGTDQGEPDAQWLRRFAGDGIELWRVPVEVSATPSRDEPLQVAVSDTDSIYVAGWSRMESGNDGFLAKYAADGVEQWQAIRDEGELNVRPCDVVATNEAIVVAGYDFVTGEDSHAYWLRGYAP